MSHDKSSSTSKYLSWGAKKFIEHPSSKVLSSALFILMFLVLVLIGTSSFFEVEQTIETVGQTNSSLGFYPLKLEKKGRVLRWLVTTEETFTKDQNILEVESNGSTQLIKAPFEGSLVRNTFMPGEVFGENETLAELAYKDAKILVEAWIDPIDIAKIKKDAKVYIAFDAYSSSKYGYFLGTIASFEKASSHLSRATASNSPGFKVLIEITDQNAMALKNSRIKLYPGMGAKIKVVWNKTSFTKWFKEYFFGI